MFIKPPYKVWQGNRIRWEGVTREWLFSEYMPPPAGKNKSTQQIADELGAHYKTVFNWRQRYGVSEPHSVRHARRMSGDSNPAYTNGAASVYHKNVLRRAGRPKRCEWCGAADKIHLHHVDHNTSNGDLSNLMWLCHYCNVMEANIWALQKRGYANMTLEETDGRKRLIVTFRGEQA